jgi:uncharacterized membrane protein
MSGLGVVFAAYLTYLEAAVIKAWCRWCLVSAGIISLIFLLAVGDLRSRRTARSDPVDGVAA